jgi:hypothetical protein
VGAVNLGAPHLSLPIDGDLWDIYISGVRRIGDDLFVQLTLVGLRICTITARIRAADDPDTKAKELIVLIVDWLSSERTATHAFLESPRCICVRA